MHYFRLKIKLHALNISLVDTVSLLRSSDPLPSSFISRYRDNQKSRPPIFWGTDPFCLLPRRFQLNLHYTEGYLFLISYVQDCSADWMLRKIAYLLEISSGSRCDAMRCSAIINCPQLLLPPHKVGGMGDKLDRRSGSDAVDKLSDRINGELIGLSVWIASQFSTEYR